MQKLLKNNKGKEKKTWKKSGETLFYVAMILRSTTKLSKKD